MEPYVDGEGHKAYLNGELSDLEKKASLQIKNRRMFLFISIFMMLFTIASSVYTDAAEVRTYMISFSIFLLVLPVMAFFAFDKKIESRIYMIKDELDLLEIGTASLEMRAEKQFKIHQNELKRYYDQALKQGSIIFIIGIINLLAGIAIIFTTLYLLTTRNSENSNVIVGIIGGSSGILTNFIAVIYLKMYSSITKSLNDFHNRLVLTNQMHYSNLLISKIFDEKLRSETWAKLALSLAGQGKSNEQSKD